MKKALFFLGFLSAAIGLYAGTHIIYTVEYPTQFNIYTASIIGVTCGADKICTYEVSITYSVSGGIASGSDNNALSVRLLKVTGFSADQDPVIIFKASSFTNDFQVGLITTTRSY